MIKDANMKSVLTVLVMLVSGLYASVEKPTIGIYTNGKSIEKTASIFEHGGFDVRVVLNDSFADFCGNSRNVLVIGADEIVHHSVRKSVDGFLKNAGSLMIMNPDAMNYEAFTVTRKVEVEEVKPLLDFNGGGEYKIEIAPKSTITADIRQIAGGAKSLRMKTDGEIGGSAFVEIPVKFDAELTRLCIEVSAKGDIQFDILTARIFDGQGNSWVGFVEMSNAWSEYRFALSDMLPEKDNSTQITEVKTEDIVRLQIGLDSRTIWGEAGGTIYIGKVNLLKYNTNRYPYSAVVAKHRTQFKAVGADYPQWLFYPAASNPQPGGNTESYLDVIKRTAARIIPAPQANGNMLVYSDGDYKGAAVALFGEIESGYDICKAAMYMSGSPKILDCIPDTKPAAKAGDYDLHYKVYVYNPLREPVAASLELDIAGGILAASANAELAAREVSEIILNCGAVPDGFPFTKFDISLSLETAAGGDAINESIDVEHTLVKAAERLISMQKVNFADWAYTHWFYSDAYAARMLRALGEYKSNQDYTNSAMRWADVTAAVQTDSGAYPMGYGMKNGIYYIADNGSIALGVAQLASYSGDMERKALIESVRKGFDWRKSYKVTPQRAKELEAKYGQGAKGTQVGNYGVGIVNQDHVTDKGMYETPQTEYRGVWYTLACTMGFPAAMAVLTGEAEYIDAAKADARMYLDTALTATDSYAPEGLVWLYEYIDDAQMKAEIKALIVNKFIDYFPRAADRFWLYGGSRQTLLVSAIAHCMHNIENSQRTRAAVLESVIGLCGEYSPYSMLRVSADYPKATYSKANNEATMYLNFGSFGLMEILVPGSTMLKKPDCE